MTLDVFYVLFVALFLGPAFGIGVWIGRRGWWPESVVHKNGKRCILRWVHVEKDKTLTVCRRDHGS